MYRCSDRVICKIRELTLTEALKRIGATWRYDNTFRPRRNPATRLVLVENQIRHVEMIVTEPVFLLRRRGTRERIGAGRGAIDLAMQLTGCTFPEAVRRLSGPGLE